MGGPELIEPHRPSAAADGELPVSATKRCPFCAEEIQSAAIICRFCNRDLASAPHRRGHRGGGWLLAAGIAGAFYFLALFDTSVPLATGGRINNLGLMNDQQNGVIFCMLLALVGAVVMLSGRRK
jgi:hypothetical protein